MVVPGENEKDFSWLNDVLESDTEKGLTPLVCIANVHSSLFHNQSVTKLQVRFILHSGCSLYFTPGMVYTLLQVGFILYYGYGLYFTLGRVYTLLRVGFILYSL